MTNYPCTYFVSLHDLKLPPEQTEWALGNNMILSSSENTLNEIFTEGIPELIGLSETSQTYRLKSFTKYTTTIPSDKFSERKSLIDFLNANSILCQALWLVKDNSIHPELGHLIYIDGIRQNVHSNFLNTLYSNVEGKFEPVEYSKSETLEAIDFFPKLVKLSTGESNPYTKLHKNVTRFNRALLFLQSARMSFDLGSKVAHYCSAFECLFSTSTSELRHRLSETMAFFLESEDYDPKETYEAVKVSYDLRSSVVHGSSIPSKFSKNNFKLLVETVRNCDNYSRSIIKKILLNQKLLEIFNDADSKVLSNYLTDLIFYKED